MIDVFACYVRITCLCGGSHSHFAVICCYNVFAVVCLLCVMPLTEHVIAVGVLA